MGLGQGTRGGVDASQAMRVKGRHVTVEGDPTSDGKAILIRKIIVDLPEGVMHKLGSDRLRFGLELSIDDDRYMNVQMTRL
jgi:hypothetical protein